MKRKQIHNFYGTYPAYAARLIAAIKTKFGIEVKAVDLQGDGAWVDIQTTCEIVLSADNHVRIRAYIEGYNLGLNG